MGKVSSENNAGNITIKFLGYLLIYYFNYYVNSLLFLSQEMVHVQKLNLHS